MSGFSVLSDFMRFLDALIIFLKGMLMGAVDTLPGVSGGTVAFITGIYERLIFGIKDIDFAFIEFGLKGQWKKAKENFLKIDFEFFIPLSLGITCSFLILARVLHTVLSTQPAIAYAFFFGLIAGSARVIFKSVSLREPRSLFAFIFGIIFAVLFVSLGTLQTEHSPPIIFMSTIIASSAMLLPGISGSFMLLFLGQYDFIIGAVNNLNLFIIFIASAGGFVGFITFSRVLAYLLKRHRNTVLATLTGLILGSLKLPFERVVNAGNLNTGVILTTAAIGFIFVLVLDSFSGSEEKHKE